MEYKLSLPSRVHIISQKIFTIFLVLLILLCSYCNKQSGTVDRIPLKIVTFGDSITRGTRDGVTDFQTFTYYLGELLIKRGFQIEMVRKGISGEKTNEALARIKRDVIVLKPHYVTVMYGTNDAYIDIYLDKNNTTTKISLADYKRNLIEMVSILKKENITPILMTPIPMGKFWGWNIGVYSENDTNFKLKEYVAVIRDVASAENILLVDHFKEWLDWKERGKNIDDWMTDGIHPNPKGHRLMAATIAKVLIPQLVGQAQ